MSIQDDKQSIQLAAETTCQKAGVSKFIEYGGVKGLNILNPAWVSCVAKNVEDGIAQNNKTSNNLIEKAKSFIDQGGVDQVSATINSVKEQINNLNNSNTLPDAASSDINKESDNTAMWVILALLIVLIAVFFIVSGKKNPVSVQ
jgi:hypothetical protein